MHQNRGQLMRRMTSANGQALLNGKGHAMSVGGGGGYTMALVPRERVDYSVAKGGLRQFAVIFIFIFASICLYTIMPSRHEFSSSIPLDIDGDGDIDEHDAQDDDADDAASLQASRKLQKDKEERETPSRSPSGEKAAERRRKEGGVDTGGDDEDADEDGEHPSQSTPDNPSIQDDDDDDDDDEPVEASHRGDDDGDDDDDEGDEDEEDETGAAEAEEEEMDPAELRAKEELMLRALKEKAEARRRERSERRMAKKAAKHAAKFGMSLEEAGAEEEEEEEAGEEESHSEAAARERRKAASARRQVSPARQSPTTNTNTQASAPPLPEPATDQRSRHRRDDDDDEAKPKIRFTRKRGRKYNVQPEEDEEEEKEEKEAAAGWIPSVNKLFSSAEVKEEAVEEEAEEEEEEPAHISVVHHRRAKGRVRGKRRKSRMEEDEDDDDDDDEKSDQSEPAKDSANGEKEDDDEPGEMEGEDLDSLPVDKDVPKPVLHIRTYRTKGKFPKKPKRRPRMEEDEPEEEEEEEEPEPVQRKPAKNKSRRRQKVAVETSAETCIQRGNCGGDEEEDEAPIEVRYFRTKGNYQKRLAEERRAREAALAEKSPPPPPPPPPTAPPLPPKELKLPEEEEEKEEEEDETAGEKDENETGVEGEEEGDGKDDDDEDEDEESDTADTGKRKSRLKSLRVSPRSLSLSNAADAELRRELDSGDEMVRHQRKLEAARVHFARLVYSHPNSPRSHFGLAKALDGLSEKEQSNALLEEAIAEYAAVLALNDVPDKLYLKVLHRFVDRCRFRGWPSRALAAQKAAIKRYPYNYSLQNELGLSYLLMGRNQDAKRVFNQVLAEDSEDGFALCHLGFILKTVDEDLQGAVEAMSAGMATGDEGTDQPRFYFHLGDALQRLGKVHQAYKVYDEGARRGYFASRMQRSLYNVAGLQAKPWWSVRATGAMDELEEMEKNWKAIRDEGLALLDAKGSGTFKREEERLTSAGDWRQFTLYQRGHPIAANCARAPKTCALIEAFPRAAGCRRGQVKFSVMQGGTRVHPHCGPTNTRLRAHLGLVTPIEPRIRVANETRAWKLGKWIIFDDSFEHEVWHPGTLPRLVLILDMWHPGLSPQQQSSLSPI